MTQCKHYIKNHFFRFTLGFFPEFALALASTRSLYSASLYAKYPYHSSVWSDTSQKKLVKLCKVRVNGRKNEPRFDCKKDSSVVFLGRAADSSCTSSSLRSTYVIVGKQIKYYILFYYPFLYILCIYGTLARNRTKFVIALRNFKLGLHPFFSTPSPQ